MNGVGSIRFANDRDGWIFGHALWSTHDGGFAWHSDSARAVIDLQVQGANVWALEAPASCLPGASCRLTLWRSEIGQPAWHNVSTTPAKLPTTGVTHLVMGGVKKAEVVSAAIPTGNAGMLYQKAELFSTGNAGLGWQQRSAPCASTDPRFDNAHSAFVALGTSDIQWLMCGGVPGGSQQDPQLKTLYRSRDGGRTWHRIASTAKCPGSPCVLPATIRGLPELGEVFDFITTSTGQMWLALSRGALWSSDDGGIHWSQSLPYPQQSTNGGGVTVVDFSNSSSGAVLGVPSVIFHTNDGGKHWTHGVVH